MAGAVKVALHEALAAPEGCDGLASGGFEELRDLFHGVGDLHAATATTKSCLYRNGQTVLFRKRLDLLGILDWLFGARGQWCINLGGDVARSDLIAELANSLGGGADPSQPSVDDGFCEVTVFGEESVTGVHGICAGLRGRFEDLVHVEVGLGGGLSAQSEGFISHAHEGSVGIRLCVHSDGGQPLVASCADHPHGNFAAVGDKHLGDSPSSLSHVMSSTIVLRDSH